MSRPASLPGAVVFFHKFHFVWKKPLVPGNFAAWDRLFRNIKFLGKKPRVPGNFAAWERTFFRIFTFLEETTCPGQLRCLGQNSFIKNMFLSKPLVWGSCAAWGRTVSQKFDFFLRNHLFGATALPGVELFLRSPSFS